MGDRKQPTPSPGDPGYTGPPQFRPTPPPPPPRFYDPKSLPLETERIKAIQISQGDVIVLEYSRPLPLDERDHIERYMSDAFGHGCRVLVLTGGLTLAGVLSQSQVQDLKDRQ